MVVSSENGDRRGLGFRVVGFREIHCPWGIPILGGKVSGICFSESAVWTLARVFGCFAASVAEEKAGPGKADMNAEITPPFNSELPASKLPKAQGNQILQS